MKKTILSFFLLLMAASVSAQNLILGDTNQDGKLNISDVTQTVNMILGKEAQKTLDLNPYRVDNAMVAGTWYMPDGTSFDLNADGTTTFPGGKTFKFMPSQGNLIIYDATGKPIRPLALWEVTEDYLLVMDYLDLGNLQRYTSTKPVVLVTSITLSETNLKLQPGDIKKLTATVLPSNAENPKVEWKSTDDNVAMVYGSGIVEAVGEGSCTITCSATDGSGVKGTCQVTVIISNSGTINGRDYIDLGLPSGTLWATCNIGASNPEDYGDYFAWGETSGYKSGKRNFNWPNYKYNSDSPSDNYPGYITKYCKSSTYGKVDGLTELVVSDDAAYVNWDSNWRMPSKTQCEELYNSSYTTTIWTTENGVYGRKITSKSNGNSIFLPAAGFYNGTSLEDKGTYCYHLSRTLLISNNMPFYAYNLMFSSSTDGYMSNKYRSSGLPVRPVRNL